MIDEYASLAAPRPASKGLSSRAAATVGAPANARGPYPLHVDRLARIISHVAHPALVVTLLLVSLPLRVPGTPWLPALLGALFTTGIPSLALFLMRYRGQVSNLHVTAREQRRPLLVVALVSILIGITLLLVINAPGVVLLDVGLVLAGLLITGAVTLMWKISIHSAVAAFAFLYAGADSIAGVHLAVVATAAVGWSRIRIDHHTPTQVMAGTVVGAFVSLMGWLVTLAG